MTTRGYDDLIPVPRSTVTLPIELPVPHGFVVDRPETWPLVEGQVEFTGGSLYYMPPSADRQQDTTADVVTVLGTWRKSHRDFVVAGNEAGMILGGEARGADAAVWRRRDVGRYEDKFRRVPPVLAVEVQGKLESETMLRDKAGWYLSHGVDVIWLVLPRERRVIVITSSGERAVEGDERLPPHASLPELEPVVAELFDQLNE